MKFLAAIGIMGALAIALGLGYMMATSNGAAVDDNIASQTVKATEQAKEQVDVMMNTFTKMSPAAPANAAPQKGANEPPAVADAQEPNPQQPGGATVSTRDADVDADAEGFTPKADSPHSSEVQEAFALMQQFAEGGNLHNDTFVAAARQLKDAWEPLFEQSYRDYEEMNIRITLAKETAEEYFAQQSRLTNSINDPAFRTEMVAHDVKEREIFTNWSVKADEIAASAYEMMQDMEDVNVFITKANLSAHFAALQKSTSKLPVSMIHLNEQLNEFRSATHELTQTIGQGEQDDGV